MEILSDVGQKKDELVTSAPKAARGSTTSRVSSKRVKVSSLVETSAIAESQAPNKKMTLPGKSNTCQTSFPSTTSLAMLLQGSTLREKDFSPYWNQLAAEMSERLWLPTETDFAASDLSLSDGFVTSTIQDSWFSTSLACHQAKSLPKTYWQCLESLAQECTDLGSTETRSRKIRIYPNPEQRKTLQSWFGSARFSYNETISRLKEPGSRSNWYEQKGEILHNLPDWTRSCPYQIKSLAIKDACAAVSAAKRKFKITKRFQTVRFRRKKDKHESVFIPKQAIKEKSFYVETMGAVLRLSEPLPKAEHDARLIFDHGRYYLCIPEKRQPARPENQRRGVVALDPGVRTFLTCYSDSCSVKVGASDFGRIQRHCYYLDEIISKISKAKSKQKRRLRLAVKRINWRIRNLIDDIHYKTALWLCNNFSIILLPKFETSKMVSKLRSKTARAMLTWSHYKFRQRIKSKAWEKCCIVIDSNEAYTSQTCSKCGHIQKIGSASQWTCKVCKTRWDRDINGARGILLRALVGTPILASPECFGGYC